MESVEILVIGGSGLVGGAVLAAAHGRPRVGTHFSRVPEPPPDATLRQIRLDVTDATAVRALVSESGARVVVNAAISTRPADGRTVSVDAAGRIAEAAHAAGAACIHLSTDMVFDGSSGPYDEDAAPSPITPYGAAKLDAERTVRAAHPSAVIARLPLIYSVAPLDRGTAGWLEGARAGTPYPLFVDEFRSPANAADIGRTLARLAGALAGDSALPAPPPIVHLPGPRSISRHDLGRLVLAALGLPAEWAIAGHAADANPPRPRDLVLLAKRTPGVYLVPLRDPADVLRPAAAWSQDSPPTPPTPPAGR